MLLDYQFAHCNRRCAASQRILAAGENYYSTLHIEGGVLVRRDFAADAWSGPPTDALAWWQARVADGMGPKPAPEDALLNLFAALAGEPGQAEFRYVLGLLLLRRRLVKLDETRRDEAGEVMVLDCPRREEQFELRVLPPAPQRAAELETRLGDLLSGGER